MPSPRLRSLHLPWLLLIPLLLWWALRDIRPAEVLAALGRLGVGQVVALIVVNIVTFLSFSGRWWIILRAQGYGISYSTLTRYRLASFGVSYFTPGPQFGGEPLQVYLLGRNHRVPGPIAAAATIVDKVLELLVNFAFLAFGLIVIAGQNFFPLIANAIGPLLIMLALPLAFLASAWFGWRPLTWLMAALSIRSSRYQRILAAVRETESEVAQFCRTQPRSLLAAAAVSILSWGFSVGEYWLAIHFLGLILTPFQLMVAVTLNRLAFLAPLPGGLGALESSQVIAMTTLGLDPAIGVTQSLLIRTRDVLTGLLGLWWGARDASQSTAMER
jgi:uncharacterized protein (TIRG00374 family)